MVKKNDLNYYNQRWSCNLIIGNFFDALVSSYYSTPFREENILKTLQINDQWWIWTQRSSRPLPYPNSYFVISQLEMLLFKNENLESLKPFFFLLHKTLKIDFNSNYVQYWWSGWSIDSVEKRIFINLFANAIYELCNIEPLNTDWSNNYLVNKPMFLDLFYKQFAALVTTKKIAIVQYIEISNLKIPKTLNLKIDWIELRHLNEVEIKNLFHNFYDNDRFSRNQNYCNQLAMPYLIYRNLIPINNLLNISEINWFPQHTYSDQEHRTNIHIIMETLRIIFWWRARVIWSFYDTTKFFLRTNNRWWSLKYGDFLNINQKTTEIPEWNTKNIIKIYKLLKKYKNYLWVSLERLSYLRTWWAWEYLIDHVIWLESILVEDGMSWEVSYKLRMRWSRLLWKDRDEINEIYKNLKNAYNERSNIVHGNFISKDSGYHNKIYELSNLTEVYLQKLILHKLNWLSKESIHPTTDNKAIKKTNEQWTSYIDSSI